MTQNGIGRAFITCYICSVFPAADCKGLGEACFTEVLWLNAVDEGFKPTINAKSLCLGPCFTDGVNAPENLLEIWFIDINLYYKNENPSKDFAQQVVWEKYVIRQ